MVKKGLVVRPKRAYLI